jgi:hypothetical protein
VKVQSDGRRLKTKDSEREIPLVDAALAALRKRPKGFSHYRDKSSMLSAALNKLLRENDLRPTKRHTDACASGMIVYVPSGDPIDATRQPAFYDGTANFLTACGLALTSKHTTAPRLLDQFAMQLVAFDTKRVDLIKHALEQRFSRHRRDACPLQ